MKTHLQDTFGRQITYLRLSVTDRCDLRCSYCMAENMQFLARKDVLSLEEMSQLASAFIARGVRTIRLTGGEPLVRRDILYLIENLSKHLKQGTLDELTLTSNGTQLARFAEDLKRCGIKRINISLDSRNPKTFAQLARRDALSQVLNGIDAALDAGLKIKLNMVVLKNINEHEIADMIIWAHQKGMDISLIEIMPMGETGTERFDQYQPLTTTRRQLEGRFSLRDIPYRTAGPSRYTEVLETGGRLGFITPLTDNFCADCNRLRLTCTGRIYMCLGQNAFIDLRAALRSTDSEQELNRALNRAMLRKPERHEFDISRPGLTPAIVRHMSVTGG